MPGTGGFRKKVRWADDRRGKGKQSSLPGVYYYLGSDCQIWFFTLYDKDEASDFTAHEKRALKSAIEVELAARRQHL